MARNVRMKCASETIGDPRQRRDVERLREVAVHRVARAEHPAIGLLDGAAHPAVSRR